jgi:hypothetical protein
VHRLLNLGLIVVLATFPAAALAESPVVLAKDGVPQMPILSGSVQKPVDELRHYLSAISGGQFEVAAAREGKDGIHVGLASDFPWRQWAGADKLGREGFILRSDNRNVFLIGRDAPGVRHAVATFLQSLGCRWFFPGQTWEVIPRQKTIAGQWNERQTPSFALQRKIWYGFGASPECARDLTDWERHNRMGGAIEITIGHTWHGLDPKADFEEHPDWFALVAGKRQPSKPCYSHPQVIERATQHALAQAARGSPMVSMTPPDGLGYCECERCRAVCQGGEPYQEQGATFAKRPDGVLINVTSQTLFAMINQVATAVAQKHPQTLIGCYAYSAYSHPPSFPLAPNVFLQTTTAFRRTPLSLAQQLEAFHKIGVQSGIRGYYSVYQWDWDYPTVNKGDLYLPQLVSDLRFFQTQNVQSINCEMCINWPARGPGYYLASRLMWNVDDDPHAIIADFYDKAFGPAAIPIERYYVRWLGPLAAVTTRVPASVTTDAVPRPLAVQDELGAAEPGKPQEFSLQSLSAAYRDLDEAARRTRDKPEYLRRIDHLRMYVHYLFLRTRVEAAAKTKDTTAVRAAIANETIFGARLMNANVVHSRPLVGKEFYRRFSAYKEFLEGTPEWPMSTSAAVASAAGKGYRQTRTDVPGADELERLWLEDKKELGIE